MASTKSLEEMLSSDVDESAVSALVGSLESQLASPTIHVTGQEISTGVVTNNHVNNTTLAGTLTVNSRTLHPPSSGDGQKHGGGGGVVLNSAVSTHSTNNSALVHSDSAKNVVSVASVVPATTIHANYSVTLPGAIPASGYVNQFQTIRVPAPNTPGILQRGGGTTGGPNIPNGNAGGGGIIAATLTASKAPLGVITTMAGAPSAANKPLTGATVVTTMSTGAVAHHNTAQGIAAMRNLANVAAQQQPLTIPTSQQQQQVLQSLPPDRGRVMRRPDFVGNDPASHLMSRFPMTRSPEHFYSQQGHPTQTVIAVANKPGQPPSAGMAPGGANMVMSNQQILQGVQIVNVNQVRAAGPGGGGPLGPHGQKTLAPRVVLSNPVRIAAGPQVIGARPGTPGAHGVQNTITLQPGMVRGTLLVKTENGQYQLVNVGSLGAGAGVGGQGPTSFRFQSLPPGSHASFRPVTTQPMTVTLPVSHANQHIRMQQQSPQVMHTVLQTSDQSSPGMVGSHPTTVHSTVPSPSVLHHVGVRGNPVVAVQSTAQQMQHQHQQQQHAASVQGNASAAMMPNAAASAQSSTTPQMSPDTAKKKCKNFLSTLLRLASDQPDQVATNVKNLIQGLIDGVVLPEDFTNQLQRELNSSPQPCLIPFLKKSLPYLRYSLTTKELSIEGVRPPPAAEMPSLSVGPSPMTSAPPTTVTPTVAPQVHLTQRPNLGQQHPHGPSQPPTVRFMSHHAPGAVNTQPTMTELAVAAQAQRLGGMVRASRQPGQRFAPPLISTVPSPSSGTIRPITATPSSLAFTQAVVAGLQRTNAAGPRMAGIKAAAAANAAATSAAASTLTVTSMATAATSLTVASSATATITTTAAAASLAASSAAASALAATAAKEKEKRSFSSTLKDDDDINDVAAMGGVNLVEESARIMAQNAEFIGAQIRSCKDENFLFTGPLQRRIREIALRFGLEEPPPEVAAMVSHATQERLKDLVEKVGTIAEHRLEFVKGDVRHEVSQDVKGQLKFLEELDRLEKKRHEEQEREMLLRAAKSRSKLEDPEQLKLKQKAKEMQRAEMEEMRQREANLTALQAIGPRKKFKADPQAGGSGGGADGQQTGSSFGSGANSGSTSSSSKAQMSRPRVKRVNLRDLLFLMEQERETCRSVGLYKAFLK